MVSLSVMFIRIFLIIMGMDGEKYLYCKKSYCVVLGSCVRSLQQLLEQMSLLISHDLQIAF